MTKLDLEKIPHGTPDHMVVHVVPSNDLREHECNHDECWCQPEIEEDGPGYVVIHHSLDGREMIEGMLPN